MADRDPWIKFRPDYWLNDLELRSCSPTAKAALVDLMCIMHASRKYGYLLVNSTKPELKDVGKWFGWSPALFKKSVEELLQKGALKQDNQGVIYSQRLVSDWEERQEMKRRGSLGGNPDLDKQEVKQEVNLPSRNVVKADKNREDKEEEEEKELPPEIFEYTEMFRQMILTLKPDRKLAASWEKNTALAIDRMVRLDGRDLKQIGRVIKWSQQNSFWWKNILSGEKLREKFDQLEADMGTESKPKPQAPVDDLERTMIPLKGKNYTQKQIDDLIAVDQVVRTQSGYRFTTSAERKRALELKEQTRQIASARSV